MKKLSEQNINELLTAAKAALDENVGLTSVFIKFADKYGRAKGGVRNLYYSLIKKAQTDGTLTKKYPALSYLKANRGRAFTAAEQEELFEKIRSGVKKGKSARKTIRELSRGDEKTALRYQNKYRNMLKQRGMTKTRVYFDDAEYKAVKKAIDDLFERVIRSSDRQNRLLHEENRALKERIKALSPNENTLDIKNFFAERNEDKFDKRTK